SRWRTRRTRSSSAPTAPGTRTSTSRRARRRAGSARLPGLREAEPVDVFAGPPGPGRHFVAERLEALAARQPLAQGCSYFCLRPALVAAAAFDEQHHFALWLDAQLAEPAAGELFVHLG